VASRDHHRPVTPGALYFESVADGPAPDEAREIAERMATVLVRGARAEGDADLAERVLHLADDPVHAEVLITGHPIFASHAVLHLQCQLGLAM